MNNTTNHKYKQNLIDFEEFIEFGAETSNYETPDSAIIPQKGDKIWHAVKRAMSKAPNWGHKFKEQEKDNKVLGKRDDKTGDKPIEGFSVNESNLYNVKGLREDYINDDLSAVFYFDKLVGFKYFKKLYIVISLDDRLEPIFKKLDVSYIASGVEFLVNSKPAQLYKKIKK